MTEPSSANSDKWHGHGIVPFETWKSTSHPACGHRAEKARKSVAETRVMIESEVGKVSQTSATSTKSTRESVDALKAQLDEARWQTH